jgi:hypothetical protein
VEAEPEQEELAGEKVDSGLAQTVAAAVHALLGLQREGRLASEADVDREVAGEVARLSVGHSSCNSRQAFDTLYLGLRHGASSLRIVDGDSWPRVDVAETRYDQLGCPGSEDHPIESPDPNFECTPKCSE